MEDQTLMIIAAVATAVLGIGGIALVKVKNVLQAVQDLMKNFLMAIKDGELTKEEISSLIKDGKKIGEALAKRYEEKDEEEKTEESEPKEELKEELKKEEKAAPKKAAKKSSKKSSKKE
jgi:hypothetical protein